MGAYFSRRARGFVILTGLLLAVNAARGRRCYAQDSDAVSTDQDRHSFSVADQIADPAERRAFVALYGTRSARERLKLSDEFLARYPQSWVLPQVDEVAAKAAIELGDYDRTLTYGRESLRLLPENPLLLVPLANVEVQRGMTAKAKENARNAIEYLDRFGRPATIPRGKWPEVKRRLEASCYFVLGRAASAEALRLAAGSRQIALLEDSLDALLKARALDPSDPESAYLAGLNDLALGRGEDAALNFAATVELGGTLKPQALKRLRKLYEASRNDPGVTFDTYLANVETRVHTSAPVSSTRRAGGVSPLPEYVGSETCRMCHPDIYRAWSQTGMARMFRPYQPRNALGDFERHNEFYEGDEVRLVDDTLEIIPGKGRRLFARAVIEQGRHYFDIKQSDGQWHRYPVDYTIGSKWQQAYATRLPSGQIHVFPIQYSVVHQRWINFWKLIDVPGSERADPSTWERLDASTNYQANCAACHTSQLRNAKGGGFEPDGLVFREPGIDCEMCHGPGGRHVSSMRAGKLYDKQPIQPPVDFSRISSRDSVAICAQCHMQSALREPGPHGELNYFHEGTVFFPRFKARPYGEFSIKARFKDGRFRETTFIVESLVRTRCFRKGGVTCVHCHDPHPADATANKTSLKFRDQADQLCLQCHKELADKIEAHTRHPLNSEASRCVSCHMPRIMNGLLFKARSHQIDDIPDTELTLRFGQQDSPNACLICHRDKDADWLKRQWAARAIPRPSP